MDNLLATQELTPRQILQRYQLPRTLAEASRYLERLALSVRLLRLYQHYFPVAFAQSSHRAFPLDTEAYSPKETEFIELVDECLFPVHADFMLGAMDWEERTEHIDVRPMGRSVWDEELSEMPALWQLAVFLLGSVSADDFLAQQPQFAPLGDSPFQGIPPGQLDWAFFTQAWKQVTATVHPALAALPNALLLADLNLNNAFLDCTLDMPAEGFEWNMEDVQMLVEHKQRADDILEEITRLLEWLQEDPPRLSSTLELLRPCMRFGTSLTNHHTEEEEYDND